MCIILQNKAIRKLGSVGHYIKGFLDSKLEQTMQSATVKGSQIEPVLQQQAIKVLNFMSGAFQLMPIELVVELAPKILRFT